MCKLLKEPSLNEISAVVIWFEIFKPFIANDEVVILFAITLFALTLLLKLASPLTIKAPFGFLQLKPFILLRI